MSNKATLESKFSSMRRRCERSTARSAASYFGHGIRVCRLWRKYPRKFRAWARAAGWRVGLELHRIDLFGPYAPWNCVWLTTEAHQAVHQRLTRLYPLRSEEKSRTRRLTVADVQYIHAHPERSAVELGKELGVRRSTVWNVRAGVTWQDLHPALGSYERDYAGSRRLVKRLSYIKSPVAHLTAADIAWLYRNGAASYDAIASRLRISICSVKAIFAGELCAEFFIDGQPPQKLPTARPSKITREIVDFIYEHADMSAEDIAVELGLSADKIRDVRKGRAPLAFYRNGVPPKYMPKPRRGTGIPLSLEEVASIYLARDYMTANEIAELYEVSKSTVHAIWYGVRPRQREFIQRLKELLSYTKLL